MTGQIVGQPIQTQSRIVTKDIGEFTLGRWGNASVAILVDNVLWIEQPFDR